MTAREELAAVLAEHGYWRNPEIGGECPACSHLYYERPPGAYMDPDLDWLRGAILEHQIDALLASPALARVIREAKAEAYQHGLRGQVCSPCVWGDALPCKCPNPYRDQTEEAPNE